MAGGYWHISDRILKRGQTGYDFVGRTPFQTGYDFVGRTPFISVDDGASEFDLSEIKVILLDIKETSITIDGVSGGHITTPVFLECIGFSEADGGFKYVGKASTIYGTPVDLTAYVYFGTSTDPKKVPIKSIEFEGVTSGGGDNNN